MFHTSASEDSKERFLKKFKRENIRIRCLIATVELDNFKEDTTDTKKCGAWDLQHCQCTACKCGAECTKHCTWKNCTGEERSKFSVVQFLQTPRD
ncbi:Hypothetical predicted protein [Mytilus galloprovincialis]|uniref:Uncharacterized protein n=1 Tax=Mytilus galloprovincialis TaxID=29158 RepID=A0A8B6GFT9_MYTGA|nr:Hypothetical predicted protein [Mytilus galloprovincialis]